MVKRIAAIFFIFFCTSIAWAILGGTILTRTYTLDRSNEERVSQLWGTQQVQSAPNLYYKTLKQEKQTVYREGKNIVELVTVTENHAIPIDSSQINANLSLAYRQRGLLWYSTYKVVFSGRYFFKNDTAQTQEIFCDFPLPARQAIYDDFRLIVGKKVISKISPTANLVSNSIVLQPGQASELQVSYNSQGLDKWIYSFGNDVTQVKNFSLIMNTDFDDIDFPEGSMSPTEKTKIASGWQLTWRYANLLTGYSVGMLMPKKLNPGPWVSEVTFFAPVSLFLFFFVIFMLTTLRGIRIHPMNYFFIGGAFFSFHLLMAYLVDHIPIEPAFAISAVVSVFLVVSYMRLVVSDRFAFKEVALAQLIYLVLFSYTFFFEKFTGLAVTILCIFTLFAMMQLTGKLNWDEVSWKK